MIMTRKILHRPEYWRLTNLERLVALTARDLCDWHGRGLVSEVRWLVNDEPPHAVTDAMRGLDAIGLFFAYEVDGQELFAYAHFFTEVNKPGFELSDYPLPPESPRTHIYRSNSMQLEHEATAWRDLEKQVRIIKRSQKNGLPPAMTDIEIREFLTLSGAVYGTSELESWLVMVMSYGRERLMKVFKALRAAGKRPGLNESMVFIVMEGKHDGKK